MVVGGDFTDGVRAGEGTFTLRWFPTPPLGIAGFIPENGAPGQTITLNGTNFTGTTRVTINGVSVPFRYTNANYADVRLAVTVPVGATTGPIGIESPHGNFTTTNEFAVYPRPALIIESQGNGRTRLTWPELPVGYFLEATESLGGTSKWTRLNLPILEPVVPGQVSGEDTPAGVTRLYRLRHL